METKLFASLTGPLLGYYYPCPPELNNDMSIFRAALASSSLAGLWCSVYTEDTVDQQIEKYGGEKLTIAPDTNLDYTQAAILDAQDG